jgi:hypothetical protein
MTESDKTVARIDETLTFYSAGLGQEIEVPVQKLEEDWQVAALAFFEGFVERMRPVAEALGRVFVQVSADVSRFVEGLQQMLESLSAVTEKDRRRRYVYRRWNDPAAAADRMDWYRQQVEAQRWIRKTVRSRTVPRSS